MIVRALYMRVYATGLTRVHCSLPNQDVRHSHFLPKNSKYINYVSKLFLRKKNYSKKLQASQRYQRERTVQCRHQQKPALSNHLLLGQSIVSMI
jgi:hypothetical protein